MSYVARHEEMPRWRQREDVSTRRARRQVGACSGCVNTFTASYALSDIQTGDYDVVPVFEVAQNSGGIRVARIVARTP